MVGLEGALQVRLVGETHSQCGICQRGALGQQTASTIEADVEALNAGGNPGGGFEVADKP